MKTTSIKSPSLKDFLLKEKIGEGHWSSVYVAYSSKYTDDFCLKIVNDKERESNVFPCMIHNETEALSKLMHPNIVKLYEYFEENGSCYMLLELCSRDTLRQRIDRSMWIDIPSLFYQLAQALQYCHKNNFVHRDFKPSNIVFKDFDTPKLIDWGFACHCPETKKCTTYCGTFPFASPQCFNQIPYDGKKNDIWAFGMTLYFVKFGCLPYKGDTFSDKIAAFRSSSPLIPDLPNEPNLADLLTKLLVFDEAKRMTTDDLIKHRFFRHLQIKNYVQPLRKDRSFNTFVASAKAINLTRKSNMNLLVNNNQPRRNIKKCRSQILNIACTEPTFSNSILV